MALNKDLLEMLNGTTSLLDRLLTDIIEEILECAVYHVAGKSLEGKRFTEINFGENRLTGNKVIEASTEDNKGTIIEFSKDGAEAWIAQMPSKKIKLVGTSQEIVKTLFGKMDSLYKATVEELGKHSAAKMACNKFVEELRYGTQKQLIEEFYSIFDSTKALMEMDMDEDEKYAATKAGMFKRPEITDIIEYLKENNCDVYNIHVINDNYKSD